MSLPVEMAPLLREVNIQIPDPVKYPEFKEHYLLSERGRKDVMINMELLRAWGEVNQETVEQFNKRGGDDGAKESQ